MGELMKKNLFARTAAASGVKLTFVLILEAEDTLLSCSWGCRNQFCLNNVSLPFLPHSALRVQSRENCKHRIAEFCFPQWSCTGSWQLQASAFDLWAGNSCKIRISEIKGLTIFNPRVCSSGLACVSLPIRSRQGGREHGFPIPPVKNPQAASSLGSGLWMGLGGERDSQIDGFPQKNCYSWDLVL